MKTQLSKPARSKARYTDQYKQEALELWRASGRSAAKVAASVLTVGEISVADGAHTCAARLEKATPLASTSSSAASRRLENARPARDWSGFTARDFERMQP